MKYKKVTYFEVDFGEVEDAINKAFDLTDFYEFPDDMECNNDTKLSIDVDGNLSAYDEKNLTRFLNGEGNFMARILMNDMCRRGLIPPGEYLVNVSW